jgi:hypothetical protein
MKGLSLLVTTILALMASSRKIYIFIGQVADSMDVYKVFVYPDFTYSESFIFKSDFECDHVKKCTFDPEPKSMIYNGLTLIYFDAYTSMNMLPQSFPNPVHFRYIIDNPYKMPSIVGFGNNSEFLNYLAMQDYLKERNLIFKLDWEHNMLIKGEILKTDKLPIDADITGTIIAYEQIKMKASGIKVCYSNTLDIIDKVPSVFGVRKSEFDYWNNFVMESNQLAEEKGSTLMFNMTLFMYDSRGISIGNMELKMDELVGDHGEVLIKSFSDDYDNGRGCDLYTGSLLLKKHNFEYFYREIANGKFESLFSYDGFHGYRPDSNIRKKSHFEYDMLFFMGCFIVAGYFIYQNLLKRKDDYTDTENNEDEEIGGDVVELQETTGKK